MNLALRIVFVHFSNGLITCCKILRHGADGFTYPQKEVLLQIFMALENPLPSAGFESADLESNDRHANHCTTEDDFHTLRTKLKLLKYLKI
jgi:hypothetical protein